MTRTKRKSLTHRQIADALGLLDQHCLKSDGGTCRYVGNWSDDKIAEAVACDQGQVAYLRRSNNFGHVTKDHPGKNELVTNDRVKLRALVTVVAELIERLGDKELGQRVRELNDGGKA